MCVLRAWRGGLRSVCCGCWHLGGSVLCLCEPVHALTSSVLARCCSHSSTSYQRLPSGAGRWRLGRNALGSVRGSGKVWRNQMSCLRSRRPTSLQTGWLWASRQLFALPAGIQRGVPRSVRPTGPGLGHRPGTPAPPTRAFPAPALG